MLLWKYNRFNGRVKSASIQAFYRWRAPALPTGAINAKGWLAETFPLSARAAIGFTTTWTSPTGSHPQ